MFLNNQKILFMYDPPHLLKNICNNFKNNSIYVNGSLCTCDHVKTFCHFDRKSLVRLAPKLMEKHLTLAAFSKISVKLAAQVLSHSVAAGMSSLAQLDVLSAEANQTAQYIELMDVLFNAFNSGSVKNSGKQMGHAMSEPSGYKDFFLESLQWLDTVTMPSSHSRPCLARWRIAIHALLGLFEDLHMQQDVQFLLTDRLNKHCLENFFSCIHGKGRHIHNPSIEQFHVFFHQLLVDTFFSAKSWQQLPKGQ